MAIRDGMIHLRALVTGGAGFIGSHIAEALLARGDYVCVLDNLDPRVHEDAVPTQSGDIHFVHGDILSPSALRYALKERVDVVFHEAAMVGPGKGGADAEAYINTNINGTAGLMHAIAELQSETPPRVILASTMAIYGEGAYVCKGCGKHQSGTRSLADLARSQWDPFCVSCKQTLDPEAVTENQPTKPGTIYAISKLGQELLCMSLGREANIPVTALRYHNVYGPRMPRDTPYAGVASFFKSRLLAGLPPLVYEDGNQLRDFIHASDIARANLLVAEARQADVAFEAFNVGTGQPHTILDFAKELANTLAPTVQAQFPGSFRLGDARHIFADISKIEQLGFKPHTTFEVGVSRFAMEPTRAAPRIVLS